MRLLRGYTLIEVLIVTGLIITLATIGSISFVEALRQGKEARAYTKLGELAALQSIYFQNFDRYATFQELKNVGYIPTQYVEDDAILHNQVSGGQPANGFITDYVLDFEPQAESFRITARPLMPYQAVTARWRLMGGQEDLRTMYVTEDNVVRYGASSRPVR